MLVCKSNKYVKIPFLVSKNPKYLVFWKKVCYNGKNALGRFTPSRGEKDTMNSICRFIPAKAENEGLETVYFVYETEFQKLKQPFQHATFFLQLVTRGSAHLSLDGHTCHLRRGALVLIPPSVKYTVEGDADFAYMYITFTGERAFRLVEPCRAHSGDLVFYGFEWLIEFWQSAIRRINAANASILTESVLLYTFSFLHSGENDVETPDKSKTVFESMLAYVKNHFADADLSLRKIADIFSYTEKYLSHLFKKNIGVNFNAYLTQMRMDYAVKCMEGGMRSVREIAEICGYYDPLYFSKVFKRIKNDTPLNYMKQYDNQ